MPHTFNSPIYECLEKNHCFYVTAVDKEKQFDTIVACVVFRPSKFGAFVSYLATTHSVFSPGRYPEWYPFLHISLRKLGFGTFLLRAVQMLQVCMGFPPRLEMQVPCNSASLSFFTKRGFELYDSEMGKKHPPSALKEPHSGNTVLPGLKYNPDDAVSEKRYFLDLRCDTKIHCAYETIDVKHQILSKPEDQPATWPDGQQLFTVPFRAPTRYIDQAGGQLLLCGLPFFRFRHSTLFWSDKDYIRQKAEFLHPMNKSVVSGGLLNQLDDGNYQQWLRGEHIQWMVRWFLRDNLNPLITQFEFIPMTLSHLLVEFLEEIRLGYAPVQCGKALHLYCYHHHHILSKRFIFLVQNVGSNHWVTSVAVQPFAQIHHVLGTEGTEDYLSGFIYYNPYNSPNATHHPGHTMVLRFLLNALSFYRDLHHHEAIDDFGIPTTPGEIFKIGCQGPFGFVCHSDDTQVGSNFGSSDGVDKYVYIQSRRPLWRWYEIIPAEDTVPTQPSTDGHNCGESVVFCS